MITGIPKDKHCITDYTYVPLVLLAPKLAGFDKDRWASGTCYFLGTTVLVYTLLTDASWGLIKLIPYRTHALLDVGAGVIAIASARKIKSSKNKKSINTLVLMGITGLVVGTLSLIGSKKSWDNVK